MSDNEKWINELTPDELRVTLRRALADCKNERQRADAAEADCAVAMQQRDAWRQRAETAEAHAITWIPAGQQLPPTELGVLAAYSDGMTTTTIRALYIPPLAVLCYGDHEEPEYDAETESAYYPGGWYETAEEGEYTFYGPLSGTVTHWAALPKLPEVQL